MKISCEVIEDLLPLYIDEVCSEESKKIVEEHLLGCNRCNNLLNQMNIEGKYENNVEANLKEAEAIRNLSKKWNKKLLLSMLKGALSTLLIICLILLVLYIFVGIKPM